MNITSRFDHYNINVFDLDRSLAFYRDALGLTEVRRKVAEDGSFILVYLGDGVTGFSLELTWLRDWDRPYNMGDNEQHLLRARAGQLRFHSGLSQGNGLCLLRKSRHGSLLH